MKQKTIILKVGNRFFNLIDLEHSVNEGFSSLYGSFYEPKLDFDHIKKESFNFFDKNAESFIKHDFYFQNFTALWYDLASKGNYREAQRIWASALKITFEWENLRKKRIHKGTLYYFWAVTCIIEGDLDRGFWFMNKAYLEDIKTQKTEEPDTPAARFLYFEPEKDQYIKERLMVVKQFLEDKFIKKYVIQTKNKLNYELFEKEFLKNKKIDREIKFYFSLCMFRLEKLYTFSSVDSSNTIQCLLYSSTIFDLCKILELLIGGFENEANILKKNVFSGRIKELSKKVKKDSLIQNLGRDVQTENFLKTFSEIINNTYRPESQSLTNLEKDILIAWGFRNFGGHKIKEDPIIINNFEKIVESVMNCIFASIEFKKII